MISIVLPSFNPPDNWAGIIASNYQEINESRSLTTSSFLSVYEKLQTGADIAIGVKSKSYYDVPFLRKLISKILRKLIGFFLSIPITYTQGGLKGFRSSYKHFFLETTINRYLFDLEFVYKSFTNKPSLNVEPVTLQLKPGVFFRKMNSKILITELRNFFAIIIHRSKHS